MPRRLRLAVGALLLALAGTALAAPVAAARYPDPILTSEKSGDPSVVETLNGRVLVTTGPLVRRARWDPGEGWRWIGPALSRLPRWAVQDDVWAADLARIGDQWVLYYSARVRGLGKGRRCIGVATAPTAYDDFRPVDARPLVCHRRADTPLAWDTVPDAPRLPRRGVIDPSYFVDRAAARRTSSTRPTAGRRRSASCRSARAGWRRPRAATSSELVRADWVMENPVLLQRGGYFHLFTSEDIWARCSYRTVWRRSTDLATWPTRPRRVLLSRATTDGLCGPGGADVLVADGRPLMYFHGWVLDSNLTPPDPPFVAGPPGRPAHRVLYGAALRFTDDVPVIARYLTH